jgi:predicted alpha/beta superfamily hydrolase
MKRGLIIDFNHVAALLAHEDCKTQAAFLNVFTKELNAICETRHAAEMQATYIAAELTEETKELAQTLCFKETK